MPQTENGLGGLRPERWPDGLAAGRLMTRRYGSAGERLKG
jgi:hypothetical protein